MNKIIERLYLGDFNAASDAQFLKQHHITHILNVTTEVQNSFPTEIQYFKIAVEDKTDTDILFHIESTNNFIENARNTGSILVHCVAGVSRSASIVVAYLMWKENMTMNKACRYVK